MRRKVIFAILAALLLTALVGETATADTFNYGQRNYIWPKKDINIAIYGRTWSRPPAGGCVTCLDGRITAYGNGWAYITVNHVRLWRKNDAGQPVQWAESESVGLLTPNELRTWSTVDVDCSGWNRTVWVQVDYVIHPKVGSVIRRNDNSYEWQVNAAHCG